MYIIPIKMKILPKYITTVIIINDFIMTKTPNSVLTFSYLRRNT